MKFATARPLPRFTNIYPNKNERRAARGFKARGRQNIKGFALRQTLLSLVATAVAAATVAAAAEKAGQRAVLPHTINKSNKYGGTATRKNTLETVTAAACRKQ